MIKKVWIIGHYSGTPKHGMAFRSYNLGKSLLSEGVETTIFSSAYSHMMHTQPEISGQFTKEKIDGINFIWVKNLIYPKSKSIGRLLSMFLFSIKLFFFPFWTLDRPEVIVVSSPSPIPFINGWFWSKILKTKLVFEVRDIWPLTIVEMSNVSHRNPVILIMRLIEKFAYRSSDYIVSLLPHADDHMIKSGLDPRKFVYLPNGIFEEEIVSKEDCSIELPKDKFCIGYAGTIGIANHLDLLIDVAAKIDDEKVHFAILGKGAFKEELVAKVEELKLTNVSFYEPIPKNEVQSFLDKLDACYIALRDEKLFMFGVSPNKLFDYMLAAKPVLYCINSGNSPVKDADCGYEIKSGKVNDIVNAINELKVLPEYDLERLGNNARNYVFDKHNYKNIAKKFLSLFS